MSNNSLSKVELDEKLSRSYLQAIKCEGKKVSKVFEELEKTNKCIKENENDK